MGRLGYNLLEVDKGAARELQWSLKRVQHFKRLHGAHWSQRDARSAVELRLRGRVGRGNRSARRLRR